LANLGAIGGEIRRMHCYAAAPPTPDSCDPIMQDSATDQVRGPTRLGNGNKLFSWSLGMVALITETVYPHSRDINRSIEEFIEDKIVVYDTRNPV
jgi:hypothetical protein